jgi:hypothetical protein
MSMYSNHLTLNCHNKSDFNMTLFLYWEWCRHRYVDVKFSMQKVTILISCFVFFPPVVCFCFSLPPYCVGVKLAHILTWSQKCPCADEIEAVMALNVWLCRLGTYQDVEILVIPFPECTASHIRGPWILFPLYVNSVYISSLHSFLSNCCGKQLREVQHEFSLHKTFTMSSSFSALTVWWVPVACSWWMFNSSSKN